MEAAELMVTVLRKHYDLVYFVVPEFAMSAGTVLCMSGDKIYMDYSSSLGPIDPQVQSRSGGYIPAMGYLDKVEKLIDKCQVSGNLSEAEIMLLGKVDIGMLALFEQARNLTMDLLTDWLVKYKFKDWGGDGNSRDGGSVTREEKRKRAREVANALADHKRWRSHGRFIGLTKLAEMKIKIDDYSENDQLRNPIREFNDVLTAFVDRRGWEFMMYNRMVGL